MQQEKKRRPSMRDVTCHAMMRRVFTCWAYVSAAWPRGRAARDWSGDWWACDRAMLWSNYSAATQGDDQCISL